MTRAAIIAACLLCALPAVGAQATWGGTVMVSSNHLLRGVSRSSNDPSLSAEFHVQGRQGWFAGLWAASSRVREADSTTVELAATLGFGGQLGKQWSWRANYSHYQSPWQRYPDFYRYNELVLDLALRDALLLSLSYSPDTSAYSRATGPVWQRDALAYEASFQQPLPLGLRAHAGVGYYDLSEHFGIGYWYGSIGLGRTWRRWQADLSYVHPGAAARRVSYEGTTHRRALFQLSYAF